MHKWAIFNLGTLTIGVLVTVGIMVYSVDITDGGMSLYFLKLLCWVCAPFCLVALFVVRWQNKQNVADIITFASILLAISSVVLTVDGFIIHTSALGRMGAWALPFLQLLVAGVLLTYAKLARS